MNCKISSLNKYTIRKSPPISATDCSLGTIRVGNDGNKWQIISVGKSQRWVLCGTGKTKCSSALDINSNQILKVSGTIKFVRTSKSKEKSPTKDEIYKHFSNNNNEYAKDLIDDIADYQNYYDKIEFVGINDKLQLEFLITNEYNGRNSDFRGEHFTTIFPSPVKVKEELIDSVNGFADGCYGGSPPNECLWPGKEDYVLGEFTFTNVKVSEVNIKKKTENKKKLTIKLNLPLRVCPPGKVLSPKGRCVIDKNKPQRVCPPGKGRCVIDKNKPQRVCPPGKVLSPKGRCVIDKNKPQRVCPPGKVLSPKGRCVIDKNKPQRVCPPGKVLSPKGRCVIDKNKPHRVCPPGKGRCVIDKNKPQRVCPPGKVLSPKGRCVIDKNKPHRVCPPGKVLSPKGRCVIDKNKPHRVCPPGKVLSPKGRCVIDKNKPQRVCPPGKVLSPKGRCVIDRR
jgi:hypothetical protein